MLCSLLVRCGVCSWRPNKIGALGWGHNMKFNMGLNMMDMVAVVEKRLSDVKFPFIVMHDPEDGESFSRRKVGHIFSMFFSSSRVMLG